MSNNTNLIVNSTSDGRPTCWKIWRVSTKLGSLCIICVQLGPQTLSVTWSSRVFAISSYCGCSFAVECCPLRGGFTVHRRGSQPFWGVWTILRSLNHSEGSEPFWGVWTILEPLLVLFVQVREHLSSLYHVFNVREIKWLWIRTPIPSTSVISKERRGNLADLPSLFLHTVRVNWRWKWLQNKALQCSCTTMIKTITYTRSDKPYFCHVRLHCRWVEAQSVCGERHQREHQYTKTYERCTSEYYYCTHLLPGPKKR